MYRFALRPRWMVGHVVVILIAVVMVSLGMWQLRRLDERRAANTALEARAAAPVQTELGPDVDVDEVDRRRFRLEGTFDGERELLVRGRIRNGLPGYEVLTPLVTAPGEAVLVNRGWIPQAVGDAWPDPDVAPPGGSATVTGLARPTERAALKLSTGSGGVPIVSAIRLQDIEGVAADLPYDLAPVWIVATDGAATGSLPAVLPPPDLSNGPHLSYAIQWFLFTTIGLVGWGALIRQGAKRERRLASTSDGGVATAA